jgi:hypothetical protein
MSTCWYAQQHAQISGVIYTLVLSLEPLPGVYSCLSLTVYLKHCFSRLREPGQQLDILISELMVVN